jgi:formylglycine-generating enzyme required for sulfatase activity
MLREACYYVDSPMEMHELMRALMRLDSSRFPFNGQGFLPALIRWMELIGSFETSAYWVLTTLPSRRMLPSESTNLTVEDLLESGWFVKNHESYFRQISDYETPLVKNGSGGPLNLRGIILRPVPGSKFLAGRPSEEARTRIDPYLPYPVELDGFYISEAEITNNQYAAFIAENPRWSHSNLPELLQEGRVTERYLEEWIENEVPAGKGDYPVTGVSHYAALEFCLWLSRYAPSGYEIRLPLEEEWEWASRGAEEAPQTEGVFERKDGPEPAQTGPANPFGLKNMLGNVWEWCAEWHRPNKNLLVSSLPVRPQASWTEQRTGGERVVRGGSWANRIEDVSYFIRGSQPPEWCTPYLGFRVVAVVKP